MPGDKDKLYIAKRHDQRKALTSPTRLEIVGQFVSPGGMSIAEVAKRMGRPPTSLYYHFKLLEKVGLLKRAGSRRSGKRKEVLYMPVASKIGIPAAKRHRKGSSEALRAVAAAFRMAERDMEEAISSGSARSEGRYRNFLATRLHCRLTKKSLAQVNTHLRAIDKIIEKEKRGRRRPSDAGQYCSLTIALMPLRGRSSE
jgi:AcrR family transcriptional regulator